MGANGSSSTSSRISRTSSTSDPPLGPAGGSAARGSVGTPARIAALVRLGHPFPSLLDGAITGVLAYLAGAPAQRAVLLAVAMVALQVSIGALNDLTDIERDRGHKPAKPLPTGAVGRGTARLLVAGGLTVGLGLSWVAGPAALAVAVAGTTTGYAYDLRLKATAWAWLPFAIGIPLVPVYAWVGGVGRVPPAFVVLLPLAVAAGGVIALLNGLVDVDRDRAAGIETPVLRLGRRRARQVAGTLGVLVAIGVLGSLACIGAEPAAWLAGAIGALLTGVGTWLAGSGRAAVRERGWEAGAVGLALLAAGWAIGFARAGLL